MKFALFYQSGALNLEVAPRFLEKLWNPSIA